MSDYLIHYGVKGMKWGVRKYTPGAIIARRRNKKVDESFRKWKEGAANRDAAIAKGKAKNEAQLAYELNKTKENKAAYKDAKKAYKQAYKKNTTYRKGTVRQEVGADLSRKYMSAAKKSKNPKQASDLMARHDVERAKARRAQQVGANRSRFKAGLKRSATITVKASATSAAVAGGVYILNKKGYVSINQEDAMDAIDKGKRILDAAWKYL